MATHPANGILDDYASSLKQLEVAGDKQKIRADHVLAILVVRDDIQRTIAADGCQLSTAEARRLIDLDERLRKNAGAMTRVVRERQLSRWRSTVNVEEKGESLLQIGSEFTKAGKDGFDRRLQAGRRLRND